MNLDLAEKAEKWAGENPFDVIFAYLTGELIFPETLERLARLRAPMVNLSLNDKEGFVGKIREGRAMGLRDICRFFDLCWTSTRDSREKYCAEGALPLFLPEAANPDLHRPLALPKTIDVSFVGQSYGDRPEIIRRLAAEGIRVETFGNGWPKGPVSTEEMVRIYAQSRINLGFGGIAGLKKFYCLKGRDFEVPMSGGLYLTEYHPELAEVYELQEEIVAYRDFSDLVAKIRFLLAHPEEAEAIRRRGRLRALAEHTWELRFEKVFSLVGIA